MIVSVLILAFVLLGFVAIATLVAFVAYRVFHDHVGIRSGKIFHVRFLHPSLLIEREGS